AVAVGAGGAEDQGFRRGHERTPSGRIRSPVSRILYGEIETRPPGRGTGDPVVRPDRRRPGEKVGRPAVDTGGVGGDSGEVIPGGPAAHRGRWVAGARRTDRQTFAPGQQWTG